MSRVVSLCWLCLQRHNLLNGSWKRTLWAMLQDSDIVFYNRWSWDIWCPSVPLQCRQHELCWSPSLKKFHPWAAVRTPCQIAFYSHTSWNMMIRWVAERLIQIPSIGSYGHIWQYSTQCSAPTTIYCANSDFCSSCEAVLAWLIASSSLFASHRQPVGGLITETSKINLPFRAMNLISRLEILLPFLQTGNSLEVFEINAGYHIYQSLWRVSKSNTEARPGLTLKSDIRYDSHPQLLCGACLP